MATIVSDQTEKKKLYLSNYLYLLIFIPFTFVFDINIWVFELSDICTVLFLIMLIVRKRDTKTEAKIRKYFRPMSMAFNVFIVWCIITQLFAYDYVFSNKDFINMVLKLIKWYLYGLVFLNMIYGMVGKSESYKYIFYGIIISLSLQFPIAFYETYVSKTTVQTTQLKKNDGLVKQSNVGSKNPHGNLMACYLVFLIPLFTMKKSPLLLVPIISIGLGMIATLSRGSWISFALGILLLVTQTRYKRIGVLMIVVVVIIVLKVPFIVNRLEPNDAEVGRTKTGLRAELVKEYFAKEFDIKDLLVGKGFYGRFFRPDIWRYGVHNQYVQVLWETGLIGLILFFNIYYQVWKCIKKVTDKNHQKVLGVTLIVEMFCLNTEIFLYAPMFLACQIVLTLYMIFCVGEQKIMNSISATNSRLQKLNVPEGQIL